MILFTIGDGRSRNRRWVQRRVTRYVLPAMIWRGAVMLAFTAAPTRCCAKTTKGPAHQRVHHGSGVHVRGRPGRRHRSSHDHGCHRHTLLGGARLGRSHLGHVPSGTTGEAPTLGAGATRTGGHLPSIDNADHAPPALPPGPGAARSGLIRQRPPTARFNLDSTCAFARHAAGVAAQLRRFTRIWPGCSRPRPRRSRLTQ